MKQAGVLFILLLCVLSGPLFGQTINWEIRTIDESFPAVSEIMNDEIEAGNIPLGLSCHDGKFNFLFISGGILDVSAWQLLYYSTREKLNQGITEEMEQGLFPTGIAKKGGGFYVFFVRTPNAGIAWQLVQTERDLDILKERLQPLAGRGHLPVAITADDSAFYILTIKMQQQQAKSWTFEQYAMDMSVIKTEIERNMREKRLPWGMINDGESVYISYLQY